MTTQEQAQWVLSWVLALENTGDISDLGHTVASVLVERERDDPRIGGRLTPVASAAIRALDRAGFYRAPTTRAIRRAIRSLDEASR